MGPGVSGIWPQWANRRVLLLSFFPPSLKSVSDFERNSFFSLDNFLTSHLPGRILKWG